MKVLKFALCLTIVSVASAVALNAPMQQSNTPRPAEMETAMQQMQAEMNQLQVQQRVLRTFVALCDGRVSGWTTDDADLRR